MKKEEIKNIFKTSKFSKMDVHFAGFIYEIAEKKSRELALAAALVSYHTRLGHICLDLAGMAGKAVFLFEETAPPVFCPELANWRRALLESGVVGSPGQFTPLVLDENNRLYLYRYWDYEDKLIQFIQERVSDPLDPGDGSIAESLDLLFPVENSAEIDWQRIAGFVSLVQKFTVISGGPGTGKTTTVAKILALLIQLSNSNLKIALAAPTGKAAARLQDAIRSAKKKLNCTDSIRNAIPEKASTIHRLLMPKPGTPYFRYNDTNPLPVDVVVIDEASMVDLALMAKLVQALPDNARLILLGDKNQLASVEAGAVLGDICDAGTPHSFTQDFTAKLEKASGRTFIEKVSDGGSNPTQNCIVQLRKSFRFEDDSGIFKVSQAIYEGRSQAVLEIVKSDGCDDVLWQPLPRPEVLSHNLREKIIDYYRHFKSLKNPEDAFLHFEKFCILCALRDGPYGVVSINALIERLLRANHIVTGDETWYAGRPVLISTNDYHLNLYNGDVGFVLPDPEMNDELRVFFPDPEGGVRKFHPLRLPAHETVYAMTIHKSQGSEFDEVLVILPDRDYPVLTRELLYTAITRARRTVEIWGNESVFNGAVSRKITRSSGLRDVLWGKN